MTEPQPGDVTAPVTLKLVEWQAVIDTLADGKYRVVGPLIQQVVDQINATQQQQQQRQPHLVPAE